MIIIIEVGKSCLSIQAINKKFKHDYEATAGFDFFSFNIRFNNNIIIKLQILDTSGAELYKCLIENFYKDRSLFIIVYAIDE